jgi:CTP:molybdopterin cytidylyltransferase MocA
MTTYNAHIYREMRLVFAGIEADTAEIAAAIARDKPTGDADEIDDCDGESFSALVDEVGDEQYERSVMIDFESERQRKSARKLLAALESLADQADEDCPAEHRSRHFRDALEEARAAMAEAKAAGIVSGPAAPGLLASLEAVLPYAENEAYALEKHKDSPEAEAEAAKAWEAINAANAAIAQAKAAGIPPAPTAANSEIYDTLSYVAETLSGFKPDFRRNLGLDIALEKTLAALHAAETVIAQENRRE